MVFSKQTVSNGFILDYSNFDLNKLFQKSFSSSKHSINMFKYFFRLQKLIQKYHLILNIWYLSTETWYFYHILIIEIPEFFNTALHLKVKVYYPHRLKAHSQ